jgi:hypothetical protein
MIPVRSQWGRYNLPRLLDANIPFLYPSFVWASSANWGIRKLAGTWSWAWDLLSDKPLQYITLYIYIDVYVDIYIYYVYIYIMYIIYIDVYIIILYIYMLMFIYLCVYVTIYMRTFRVNWCV